MLNFSINATPLAVPKLMPLTMQVDDQVNASVAYFGGVVSVTNIIWAVKAGAMAKPAANAKTAKAICCCMNPCANSGKANMANAAANCRPMLARNFKVP